jgi:hypothetical protein
MWGCEMGKYSIMPNIQCCQGAEISAAKDERGRKKIVWGRENLWPNFWQNHEKRAEKGPNFVKVWFSTKTVIFSAENCNIPSIYSIFSLNSS